MPTLHRKDAAITDPKMQSTCDNASLELMPKNQLLEFHEHALRQIPQLIANDSINSFA